MTLEFISKKFSLNKKEIKEMIPIKKRGLKYRKNQIQDILRMIKLIVTL
jgi:hypothetical protein